MAAALNSGGTLATTALMMFLSCFKRPNARNTRKDLRMRSCFTPGTSANNISMTAQHSNLLSETVMPIARADVNS